MKNITITFTVDPNDIAIINEVLHHYESGPRDLAATNALLDFFEFSEESCTNRLLEYLAACDPDRVKVQAFLEEFGENASFADLKEYAKRVSKTFLQ